jgi:hypothetical protein
MAKLNSQIQTFIVKQFAMYSTPQEIVDAVKAEFDVEASRPQVFFYNAEMNPKLAQKWKDLFAETRKNFLESTSSIAIAQKSYRLRELDRLYGNQKRQKLQNPVEMRATLEHAAKESGDAFTNRREVTGAGGESLTQPFTDVFNKFLMKAYGGDANTPDNK